jgi:phosphoribosylformylglycinamidine cyclo-ligase
MSGNPPLTYKDSGVDQDNAENILSSFSSYLKTRPRDPAILSGIGPFASCYSLKSMLNQYRDPILVTCCDGVGTKAAVALEWGELSGLGADLVAMNVNDLLCAGAAPFLFLDYYACGKLNNINLSALLKSIQAACEVAGCSLVGGETAEMPGIYQNQDFDLAGFSVGMAEKEFMLGAHRVKVGDRLVAIASSGPHSNGYSLIRKLVEREKLAPDEKTPFSEETWREVLLKPTIIYVPYLKDDFASIHALAHLTGGGLFGNLPRVLPANTQAVVDSKAWRMTPIFYWLQQKTGLGIQDLLTTFNGGVGMVAVCSENISRHLIERLNQAGLTAYDIGDVQTAVGEPDVMWK